jgi:hypothetical protein
MPCINSCHASQLKQLPWQTHSPCHPHLYHRMPTSHFHCRNYTAQRHTTAAPNYTNTCTTFLYCPCLALTHLLRSDHAGAGTATATDLPVNCPASLIWNRTSHLLFTYETCTTCCLPSMYHVLLWFKATSFLLPTSCSPVKLNSTLLPQSFCLGSIPWLSFC